MVELGVFLPVLNNGWVISTAAPQYQPSYAMNKAMTLLAAGVRRAVGRGHAVHRAARRLRLRRWRH
jgi:hypothetical protein